MNAPAVTLELDEHQAILTLNRPAQGNALDIATGELFVATVERLACQVRDGQVRAVLVRAEGPHFCLGGDIRGFVQAGADLAGLLERQIPPMHSAVHTLATLPVPVVCALQGSVGGGGIGLALCGDIVLAARSMKLRGGYSAIGLTPDLGSAWFLTRLAGPMKAKQILFSNQTLSAEDCRAAGLVAEVHADEALDGAARFLAVALARGASASLARIKSLVDGAARLPLAEHLDAEYQGMVASGATLDAAEGVQAFAEKRAPRFMGR